MGGRDEPTKVSWKDQSPIKDGRSGVGKKILVMGLIWSWRKCWGMMCRMQRLVV